ncbi:MAG: FAD-dependent oxidoreductase, partial [Pyrinomonadaceae bacterium]|nr:FAD-dependent oxidoreductase [Pyrinomonadaceae bacterium]
LLLDGDRVVGIQTSGGEVRSGAVIVAGGAWSSLIKTVENRVPDWHIEPIRGQMLCFDACPPLVRHVIYSPRAYLVPRRNGRLLAGSTTEQVGFDKSVTAGGVHQIARHALEIAPGVSDLTLTNAWTGLRPRTADGWPVLGASVEVQGLYYATGHYRNGILLAPITGQLIADLVTNGVASPLLKAFAPERFHPLSVHYDSTESARKISV